MKVLICPISGAKFINQAASLYHLLRMKFEPDTCIGASGGSVVISILLYALGSPEKIRILLQLIDSELFVVGWLKPFPSWVIGTFKGSAYQHSEKFINFGKDFFPMSVLNKTEFWVMTYNQTLKKPHLFTNSDNSEQLIAPVIKNITKIRYSEMFIRAILASSSIPMYTPALKIEEHYHIDGGVYAPSPLNLFSSSLKKHKKLHLVNLTGIDLDEHETSDGEDNILNLAFNCVNEITRNSMLRDRLLCLDILEHYGKVQEIKTKSLSEAMLYQKTHRATLLEIYTRGKKKIDIISFTSEEGVELFDEHINYVCNRLWIAQ